MIEVRISTASANGLMDAIAVSFPALPREGDIICFPVGKEYLTQKVERIYFYTDIDLGKVRPGSDSKLLQAACSQIWIETYDCDDKGGHPEILSEV